MVYKAVSNTSMSALSQITDWKDFERLCADLLAAEGFEIEKEPSVDRTGFDFVAIESYKSHFDEPGRVIKIKWLVQCKHFRSGTNLARKEIEEILVAFEATRFHDEGLFIIVSTDYTEPASFAIDRHLQAHRSARITLWNGRHLLTRLDRHPRLLERYGIITTSDKISAAASYVGQFKTLTDLAHGKILIISDQSTLAHNMGSGFREAGFDVLFLPFWNYLDVTRLNLLLCQRKELKVQMIVLFLGDSFGFRLPRELREFVLSSHKSGVPLLLFPFLAWAIDQGGYDDLAAICPVRLGELQKHPDLLARVLGTHRKGNFAWLLAEAFAEDQYIEIDPKEGLSIATEGLSSCFGVSYSFEYVTPQPAATVACSDTTGNPVIVINNGTPGRVCYFNVCCHACLSDRSVISPLESSPDFSLLLKNILAWLLAKPPKNE